jgi:hypothetical protein
MGLLPLTSGVDPLPEAALVWMRNNFPSADLRGQKTEKEIRDIPRASAEKK